MINPFSFSPDYYTRQVNPIGDYIKQQALYLSVMTNRPRELCQQYIESKLKRGDIKVDNPNVLYLARETEANRDKYQGTLLDYVNVAVSTNSILSPSGTVYHPISVKRSLSGVYIDEKSKLRSEDKKLMFYYKVNGDEEKRQYYNGSQNTRKIFNNSLSGSHMSPYNILFNYTAHPSLTSGCRCATSYANASNEKFLAGNRHYETPEIVIANILATIDNMDEDLFKKVVNQYQLKLVRVEEAMQMVTYSSDLYWRNKSKLQEIEDLMSHLNPYQRSYYVYNCDMHHLAIHNPEQVRAFLTDLSYRPDEPLSELDTTDYYAKLVGDQAILALSICANLMAGRLLDKVKETDPVTYAIIQAVSKNIIDQLTRYNDFIESLFRSPILPPNVSQIVSIARRAVVLSDTDSTVFTNQMWVEWYLGKVDFSDMGYRIGYVTTFIASQMVANLLAIYTTNIGIDKESVPKLMMKNEYYFPVMGLTPAGKNYFAYKSMQEGIIFKALDHERKGVQLRSSNIPVEVTEAAKEYEIRLMDTIMAKGSLSLAEVLTPIVEMEKSIINDIIRGGHKYLRSSQIRDAESYAKKEDASNYKQYLFWQEVFGPKYGYVDTLPFSALKMSVNIANQTELGIWLAEIKDRALADRLTEYLKREDRAKLTTVYLPLSIIEAKGIPTELLSIIGLRKLVTQIMSAFYLLLETLGIYMLNDKHTRLITDIYSDIIPT